MKRVYKFKDGHYYITRKRLDHAEKWIKGFLEIERQIAISDEVYYIVPDKCTECKGFHDEPQCAAVCPVDCCVPKEDIQETEEELLAKQKNMHPL